MAEKDIIYSSKTKYSGVFSFSDFYDFCYNWVMSEVEPNVFDEKVYSEKITGDSKEISVKWEFKKKLNDYFIFNGKISIKASGMKKVKVSQNGRKIESNIGEVSISVKGILVKDYQGKFENSAMTKTWRAIYEKWIVPASINQFEGKIVGDSDEFLEQAKSFLDLEGKR